jgi:hypothetical protein
MIALMKIQLICLAWFGVKEVMEEEEEQKENKKTIRDNRQYREDSAMLGGVARAIRDESCRQRTR